MTPLKGLGVNTHAQLLPVGQLRSIGTIWLRADLPARDVTPQAVKKVLGWYSPLPVLWVLASSALDLPSCASLAHSVCEAGCMDIEVFNEPDMHKISPAGYVKAFEGVRAAVPKGVRLYGPSCNVAGPTGGKFPAMSTAYLMECLNLGMAPDAITIHGYWIDPAALADEVALLECITILPVVVSETGYPAALGSVPYPYEGSARAMHTLKASMLDSPWCWYDGPQAPGDDPSVGLFAESVAGSGVWDRPTATYQAIASRV